MNGKRLKRVFSRYNNSISHSSGNNEFCKINYKKKKKLQKPLKIMLPFGFKFIIEFCEEIHVRTIFILLKRVF